MAIKRLTKAQTDAINNLGRTSVHYKRYQAEANRTGETIELQGKHGMCWTITPQIAKAAA